MKGKAAIWWEAGKPLEIREYPVPDVKPDGILVKLSLANICGSDIHFVEGRGPRLKGGIAQILGHEMMGTIQKLGREVKTDSLGQPLAEGDRLVYSYYSPCGQCWACFTGVPGCPNRYRRWLGVPADTPPHFNGAFAEYYYLHPGHWTFKVPQDLPNHVVSPVNCALAQMVYSLHRVGIMLGDTLVIQGAGGLGLYGIAVAKEMGAARVISLDRREHRLEMAKAFGADVTINLERMPQAQRLEMVRDLTRGVGADVVVEVCGSPDAVDEGMRMARVGGRYLLIGNINLDMAGQVDPGNAVRFSKTILAVSVYQQWVIPRALDLLVRCKDRYPFDKIISHTYPLEEINAAMDFARTGQPIRVALEC
ncbi:MAG: zinc-binding dehydrogenase [candidate division NC10 bacterium]|nr:zinc-binding dehydrogenase [candidate division NC10 bacterium]MBI2116155.1 zinc-binding dehydrogenase [candidate division NC10 bacterium]MBI2162974.1 zinc-binding dehydrogenase [candidate division NC10 bacterium]MBI2561333.1 zinc-binding dehydrogenase [candidate division NC10 bacterium]MBI3086240.1 zinc-binding dehydrogenase [candidate division NC10 bacterium]